MAKKINIADVQALVAFYVSNNKAGLINAMNSSGYSVPQNISDTDLFVAVGKVGDENGIKALANILKQVPVDTSKLTETQARNLSLKFKEIDPNAKFGDFLKDLAQGVSDFLGGTTVVNQNPNVTSQTSEPVLSPITILITAIIGIVAIVLINRGESSKGKTTTSWIIGVIIVAVVGYGIFAKKQTITSTGGGGNQQIHNGALDWLKGILEGLNVSVIGG